MSTFRIQGFDRLGGLTVRTLHHDDRLSSDPRVKKAFFIVEQSGAQRSEPATLFASGELKRFVKAELPLQDADRAHNGSITGHRGKIVIRTQSAS